MPPKNYENLKEFSTLAGYKISIQKSIAFLYTNNELSENELRKQSHLQVHQKNKSNKGDKITILGKLQDINGKNQRQHKQMERGTVLMD